MTKEQALYQIRLFEKGKIEIFQNVFTHKVNIIEGECVLSIKYGEPASYTACRRNISNCYKTEIINISIFEPEGPNPRDKEIIMHGDGPSMIYSPESHKWTKLSDILK